MEELIKARKDFIFIALKALGFIIITLFLFILAMVGKPGFNWIWALFLVVLSSLSIKYLLWPELQEKSQEFIRLSKENGIDIENKDKKDDE